MATFEIKPEFYNYVFSPYLKPAVTINRGDTVIFHTEDAFESRIKSHDDLPAKALKTAKFLNPQTGPVFISGAEPGDTLVVDFKSIEFTRDWAVSAVIEYFGGLQSNDITRTLQAPLKEKVWLWKVTDGGKAFYNEEMRIKIPANPFCGTCATAPDLEAIQALTPGPFGGNMDVPDVKPGNTIFLPVWNPGGLFYIGDCHGAQGQGELCGVALEITAKATVTFDVIKGQTISWPRIESPDKIMVIGSAKPMEDAARIAYAELMRWMVADYGFSMEESYQLCTQIGGLYVGNMVDTVYSLVASIEKKYLKRQ
jgi:acetamidase/formamidase